MGPAPLWAWWTVLLSRWPRGQRQRTCPMPVTARADPGQVRASGRRALWCWPQRRWRPWTPSAPAGRWSPWVRVQSPESPLTDQAPPARHCPPGPLVLWPLGLPGHWVCRRAQITTPPRAAVSCLLPRGCSLLTQVFVCPQLTRGARPPLRLPAAGRDAVGQRGGLGHALDPPELR